MHGLYINLDRAEGRRARLNAELTLFELGDRYRRIRGVADDEPYRGCWKSHAKAIAQAGRIGGIVHIIEDDVLLSARVKPFLESPQLTEMLTCFDIVFLSMWVDPFPRSRHLYAKIAAMADGGHAYVDLRLARIGSMDSYVVAPRSVAKVAQLLTDRLDRRPPIALDAYLDQLVKAGTLTAATLVPFLTCIDLVTGVHSTIQLIDREAQARYVKLRTSFFVEPGRQDSFPLSPTAR